MKVPLDWFQRWMLAVAAGIMIFQLAIPPIVGVADNGDWLKIMLPAGFRHLSDEPAHARFLDGKVAFAEPAGYERHLVSGRLIAQTARLIGRIFSRDGVLDLRVLGFLNASLLLFGLGLIMAASYNQAVVTRRVLAVLLVFIFTDLGYVAFCNSFYTQTATLIFLVITAGLFAMTLTAQSRTWLWYVSFVISATLFATSKPQEAPQVILLAPLCALMPRVLGIKRPWLLGAVMAISLTVVTVFCATFSRQDIQHGASYNAFFHELLAASPDPKADLIAFGLDPELSRWAGTHAFLPDSPTRTPEFQKAFYDKVGFADLYLFYLKRPARLWALLARRAEQAFTLVVSYGNYERSAGFPEGHKSTSFTLWSGIKRRILPGSIWTLVALFVGSFTAVVWLWRKATPLYRLGLAGFATLNLMAIGAFFICALSEGRLDIVRVLFGFNIMVDLILVALVTGITQRRGATLR